MTYQKIIIIATRLFSRQQSEKNRGLVRDKLIQDIWKSFCPIFFVFSLIIFVCFLRIRLSKTCDESTLPVGFICSAVGYILAAPGIWTIRFLQKSRLHIWRYLVGPSETGKWQSIYNWLKILTFHPKFEEILSSTLSATLKCYAKRDWKPCVCSRLKLWIYRFVKKEPRNVLVIFEGSCEQNCNSKTLVDSATEGRHRGLSTINIKHKLFHQSNLGQDVGLQNKYIVFFKSSRDVILFSMLSAQLELESELVDWYQDLTSVSYGHFLIKLSP